MREVVSWSTFTPQRLQSVELCSVFNPFGNGGERKGRAKAHDYVRDLCFILPVPESVNKTFVNLENVDWELSQITERRVTGSKIIHRQADPECLEITQSAKKVKPA